MMLVYRHCIRCFRSEINETAGSSYARNVLRLAGELPIVRVLNDLQPLLILHIFCMKGLALPPTDPP